MGLSAAEFWSMPPTVFERRVNGYFQRENKSGIYFRELFALFYNVNRGEKAEALAGKDVLRLPLEKRRRQPKEWKPPKRSQEEWAEIMERIQRS